MSLHYGRPYIAIPGPSIVPERVLTAMHQPSPDIYAEDLAEMVDTLYPDLKAVARTSGHAAIYIGNGHTAWEAALTNSFSRGDRILVLATGFFAANWAENARGLGLDVELVEFGNNAPIDMNRVEEILRGDTGHSFKAVLTVQTDTSTSIKNDIQALRACIDTAGHPALFMVDCIASLAVDRFEMDDWGVDLMVAACQKGLMTPPGICFLFFNERANAAHKSADLVTPHFDWTRRIEPERFSDLFNGTAPTHHLYGLREALTMLVHEEGIEAVWARHDKIARAVWAALEQWGTQGPLAMNVGDAAFRSRAVTTIGIGSPVGADLRNWMEKKTGVTLGVGLGMGPVDSDAWHSYFRIGHMGHVSGHMIMGLLGSMQAGMQALGIEHAQGGLDAAASVISKA